MAYRHKIIQGLAQLIERYGGKGSDPIMKSVWWGIRGQVPSILKSLDDNDEAVAEIERKVREVLGTGEAEKLSVRDELLALFKHRNKDGSISIRIPADNELVTLFPIEPAKAEVTIEPLEE